MYLPTVGRNTLRLPDAWNVDLRVSRAVKVGERVKMLGSVEAFNLTNHVNYSAVSAGVSGRGGGERGDSSDVSECGGGGGGGVE